jgi:hypothetical protein
MSDLEQRLAEQMRADAKVWREAMMLFERRGPTTKDEARYGVCPRHGTTARKFVSVTGEWHSTERADYMVPSRRRRSTRPTFTGNPCKHGHRLRLVSTNECVECERLRNLRKRRRKPTNHVGSNKH